MVNIHVFDLSKTELETPRCKMCFSETLKHQTNYKLFIWHIDDPEIEEIVKNSKYCQEAFKHGRPYVSIFQYVKMEILSRYGGWCIEADQLIETDLSRIQMDLNKNYFIPTDEDRNYQIVAWWPCYVVKGLNISKILEKANSEYSDPFEYNEGLTCKIESRPDIASVYEIIWQIKISHYVSPIFTTLSKSTRVRYSFDKDGTISAELFDYYRLGVEAKFRLSNKEVFLECCKQFSTFDKALVNGPNIEMTKEFYNFLKENDILFSKKLKLKLM